MFTADNIRGNPIKWSDNRNWGSPKRITQLVIVAQRPSTTNTVSAHRRNFQNHPVTKTKTIIDQGPYPLYCSEECKTADMLHQHEDVHAPPTYSLYNHINSAHSLHAKSENTEGSPPLDVESVCLSSTTTDLSYPSPTFESPALPATQSIVCQPKQRSRSFLNDSTSQSAACRIPSSMPTTSITPPTQDNYLLSQFQDSFTRRSESRVSMYSGPSSPNSRYPPSISALSMRPRRERPLLPQSAEGKLLVPDVYIRVSSMPSTSRRVFMTRNRTGSIASIGSSRCASLKSSLFRYGDEFGDDEKEHCDLEDEYECEDDAPLSPGISFRSKPVMSDMRAWSFDASINRSSSRERGKSYNKYNRQRYNPDGKKLFLFPTD
ncbi:hypothetical protein FB446DRAFT_817617 [Lentinula raphanica]|nr:hypothetical protein FB446DRAFT_817617 [Lentinula raphanica]